MHLTKRFFTKVIVFAFLLTLPSQVQAHSGSVGYSEVKINGNQVTYELFLLGDLIGGLLNIDQNQDGYMKDDEIAQAQSEMKKLVEKNLSFIGDGIKGEGTITEIKMVERWNYTMFQISLAYEFEQPVQEYEIDYNLLFHDIDKDHQNFLTLTYDDQVIEHVFNRNSIVFQGQASGDASSEEIAEMNAAGDNGSSDSEDAPSDGGDTAVKETSVAADEDGRLGFADYLVMGMKHIWAGIDHLLFLLGLLLFRVNYKEYIKILTAFTVGHSITLALAATETLIIPSSVIEPLIALSIVYVAVENIWAKSIKWRWLITFFFGLIHGFGFAEILAGKLGLSMWVPLLSFNLGVEIGQIVVLGLVFPLIWYVRKFKWEPKMAYSTSAIISLFGLYWFIERIL